MSTHTSSAEPKSITITLEDAMNRTNNWREAIKTQFGNHRSQIPCGFYIGLADLQAIVSKYQDYHNAKGEKVSCVGARVYFTLKEPVPEGKPLPADAIAGILVPCYEVPISVGKPGGFDKAFKDIVVPLDPGKMTAQDHYSIYDVTQPCPPMCDYDSPLV